MTTKAAHGRSASGSVCSIVVSKLDRCGRRRARPELAAFFGLLDQGLAAVQDMTAAGFRTIAS